MDFQRKTVPFLHRGMNWNSPVEKLQDGQVCWAKNIRVLEQGTVSSAHGHTQVFTVPAVNYVHSISRLNILNPSFVDIAKLGRTYVVGGDSALFTFQTQQYLDDPNLNPVKTPLGVAVGVEGVRYNAFSGNPLSIIDAQPVGAAVPWKYIGDSKQMVTVGYYPSDYADANMARCLSIGLPVPIMGAGTPAGQPFLTSTQNGDGGLLGDYQWIFAYRRVPTGARSNPSAATRDNVTQVVTRVGNLDNTSAGYRTTGSATMWLPPPPLDPQTGALDTNVVVDVYRFGGTVLRWALVGSGPGGTQFTDRTPDLNLLAAPSPPQTTDATTGLTRFNLFQPFVTQDVRHSGQAILTQNPGNGIWYLQNSAGDPFNPNWLNGSSITLSLNPQDPGAALTIYQMLSSSLIELADDLSKMHGPPTPGVSGQPSFTAGTTYYWTTEAGTLTSGQPLPHLWGPYGIGQSGSYIFACGDPNARGTLYWTNGNDPDSTDIANNIIVTSPSEKLMTGCVYDGQPYVWSTERQFQIFPSLTVFGQFTTQEVAGAKGVWMEWSLSVQSNGFADQSVTWRGKDGIYDWSGAGLQRISDPLYAFFAHDNNPGIAPETIFPFLQLDPAQPLRQPEIVGNLDDQQPKYHRTAWFQGMLFYDFVAQAPQPGNPSVVVPTFSTLVWDSVNTQGGGWVSLDQPFGTQLRPVARGVEIGSNDPRFDTQLEPGPDFIFGPMARGGNLKVSWGNIIYDYYGFTRGFQSRFITRAEDMGEPRLQKLWGDFWLDSTPYSSFTVYPLVNFNLVTMSPLMVPVPSSPPFVRGQAVLDFEEFRDAGGKGLLSPTLGIDIRWVANDGQFTATLYQWQPSFVLKPEFIEFRATDRDDQGAPQAKYLMGANVEADTRLPYTNSPQPITLNVIIDGHIVTTLTLTHDGQLMKPYAWEPVAGYEFQVQFEFPEGAAAPAWQLYKVQWIFEPWPDAVARAYPFQNLGTSGAKYVRGIVMPMETGGVPGTVHLWADDADTDYTWTKTTENLKKTGEVLDLPAPFVAHEMQFRTLTDCRIWPAEVKVDFDPWPEMSTDVSSFTNLGYQGSKFFQGIVFSAETGGRQVQITVNSDCGHSVTLPLVQTPPLCKNTFAFSFSPCNNPPSEPFIASEVQIVPDGDVRIWNDETRYVWEPEPELVATWATQPTNHDFATWHSMRDCFIAYRGGTGAPTLYITTEYGTESYVLDYVGPEVYTRSYRVLKPQKAKWRSYRVEGCGKFRLYIKDCSVRVKEWGSTAAYVSMQPFGELSRANGGARI